MADDKLRTVVSTTTKDLVPHVFDGNRNIVSPVMFDVRTVDKNGLVPDLSGKFGFRPDFRELLMRGIPSAAARRGVKPEIIGRVFKGKRGGDYLRASTDLEDDEDVALEDMLGMYDSYARRYPFEPGYATNVGETPLRFIQDFTNAIDSGKIPEQLLSPEYRDKAVEIAEYLKTDNPAEFLEATGPGLGLALSLMEREQPGFSKMFLDDLRSTRHGARMSKVQPLITQLVDNAVFNRSPDNNSEFFSKSDLLRERGDRFKAYNEWLRTLSPDLPMDSIKEFAKNISVGKSALLTNILNDSLDFTPLLGPELRDFVDPKGKGRLTDVHIPRRVGLWSPDRRSTPHYVRGMYPLYNFKSDMWKDFGPDIYSRLDAIGFDPRKWGSAASFADFDGHTMLNSDGDSVPLDYLHQLLKHYKRGYYRNAGLPDILGQDPMSMLQSITSQKRHEKKSATAKKIEERQERSMTADKSNVLSWRGMKDGERANSFRSLVKSTLNGKNKQYADMVTELGLDGYGYKDVTLDDSLKSTLRAAHDSMRDAGMPLNDIGVGLLQIIAGNRDKLPNIGNGGTDKAASTDNVDLSGIVDVLKDRL